MTPALQVGDRVVFVHAIAPHGCEPVEIASLARPGDGKVLVRTRSGGTVWVSPDLLDPGVVSLGQGRHRATDPDTARLAAEAAGERLTEHQWAVLASLVEAGRDGLIDHEHEARNGLIPTSAGKRRKELERLGLVIADGRKRNTPSGQPARVWVVTARGVAVHQLHRRGAA